MAIRKVARMGHPVLRTPATPVGAAGGGELHRLVADMLATMADEGGIGLAAPQVHDSRRVVVIDAPAGPDAPETDGAPRGELIDPVVEVLDPGPVTAKEGCLSIPGIVGEVPRAARIRYWARDLEGHAIDREATGLHARVVQHEIDHLDGVLFIDRMPDLTTLSFTSERGRPAPERP